MIDVRFNEIFGKNLREYRESLEFVIFLLADMEGPLVHYRATRRGRDALILNDSLKFAIHFMCLPTVCLLGCTLGRQSWIRLKS